MYIQSAGDGGPCQFLELGLHYDLKVDYDKSWIQSFTFINSQLYKD